jgi:phosphoglycerate kinase
MRSVKDLSPEGKTVFLRVDFNVPLKEGNIRDDTRIKAVLPTLAYLLDRGARVVCASHLGRPKGEYRPELSLKPVAQRLGQLIANPVTLAPAVVGPEVDRLKKDLSPSEVLLLENVRFHREEKTNDPGFARELAEGIDIYVNDAFGACHRAHASVVGIPSFTPECAAGFLVEKELSFLNRAVFSPARPYVAILGGAKVADKVPVILNLIKKADTVLIGGAMAYTFLAAKGLGVGRSLVEEDKKGMALEILARAEDSGTAVLLPVDHVCAAALDPSAEAVLCGAPPLPENLMALDIGPATIAAYSDVIGKAKMILWNGPMGVFEVDQFARGTIRIAEAVASSGALSIIGGGDSVAAVAKAGVSEKISHISTGGGASLEYIAEETLPGLEALEGKEEK